MEKQGLVIITTKDEFKNWLKEENSSQGKENALPDFESDKISKEQAARLINKSIPSLNKMVRDGILKVYGLGIRGKYLLKSEVIAALKNSNI